MKCSSSAETSCEQIYTQAFCVLDLRDFLYRTQSPLLLENIVLDSYAIKDRINNAECRHYEYKEARNMPDHTTPIAFGLL